MKSPMSEYTKRRPVEPVSDEDLARFLRHLSILYGYKTTGNSRLSAALLNLAEEIATRSKRNPRRNAKQSYTEYVVWDVNYKNANADDVRKLLANDGLTKANFVKIASDRFSIPKSKLQKMTVDGVKNEIKSALLHEESIKILSQQAENGGRNRNS